MYENLSNRSHARVDPITTTRGIRYSSEHIVCAGRMLYVDESSIGDTYGTLSNFWGPQNCHTTVHLEVIFAPHCALFLGFVITCSYLSPLFALFLGSVMECISCANDCQIVAVPRNYAEDHCGLCIGGDLQSAFFCCVRLRAHDMFTEGTQNM